MLVERMLVVRIAAGSHGMIQSIVVLYCPKPGLRWPNAMAALSILGYLFQVLAIVLHAGFSSANRWVVAIRTFRQAPAAVPTMD